jgi:hypothetical protein
MLESLDVAVLARALRTGTRLRDKLVVLEIDPSAAGDPGRLDALDAIAADLSLARSFGIRLVTVCAPGTGPGPLGALGPALRLIAALERHGERGVSLPAAGLVTVHRIPAAALALAPGTPPMIPVVSTTVLIHLSALGYVPILIPPIRDAAGEPVTDLEPGVIAGFIAQSMSAALLVLPVGHAPTPPAQDTGAEIRPGQPPLPPVVVTGPASPGTLIADILLHAPDVPADPAGLAGTTRVVLP